jgi:hypothetical protein
MATRKRALKIGWRPGTTLFVDGAELETSRRNSVTIRNYSSVRWEKSPQNPQPDAATDTRPDDPSSRQSPKNPEWPMQSPPPD